MKSVQHKIKYPSLSVENDSVLDRMSGTMTVFVMDNLNSPISNAVDATVWVHIFDNLHRLIRK